MSLSDELQWRGFVNQTTFDDINKLDGEPISFYLGVDPSADSMTIGNFAAMMLARHFIDHGHKAYLLVGGATGLIGDPDGKADERSLKDLDTIAANKEGITKQFRRIFDGRDFEIVDNYDWFKEVNYLDFLRNVGKHIPMSAMLDREFIKSRLGEGGSGISYAEFSYSLIQGYDFLYLYRDKGVTLQLCGADQWGNSVVGVDLIRRIEGGESHIFSTPLVINKATGMKFGKSEDGAVWLDAAKTSVYKFYQFWLNVDDAGVIDYAKIYTLLTKEAIEELETQRNENPGARAAQRALAFEVTRLVHGVEAAQSAEKVTSVLFGGARFDELSDEDLEILAAEIPVQHLGISVIDALVESGVVESRGEVRRLIQGNAISVNGEKISDDFAPTQKSLVKKGKNSFVLIK